MNLEKSDKDQDKEQAKQDERKQVDKKREAEQQERPQIKPPVKPRRPRPLSPPVVGGVPLLSQFELAAAAGVLQPPTSQQAPLGGRSSVSPPKRPAQLPSRLHCRPGAKPTQTSLGANVSTSCSSPADRPNRYSWAQMQQWHAARQQQQAAAATTKASTGLPTMDGDNAPGAQPFHHYHFAGPFGSAASRALYASPIANLSNFEHTKSRLIKFIEALKRFSEKWFSHVLLLMFLAVYACLGAYVFISFEAPTEQWEKQQIIDMRLKIVNDSYEAAKSYEREDFNNIFRSKFEDYERLLNRVCASGMTSNSLENQWTFWGALFYSMTVFTTIGYGHLTPITFAGRVATMIYAIFGIPILLMVLADLGKLLTRIIKFAFKKFNYIYNKLLGRKAPVRLRTQQLISDNTTQYFGVARDAFERRFGHYIQPYQDRLHSFGGTASHWTPWQRGGHSEEAAQKLKPARQVIELPYGERDHQLEASEVLVTPHKQTRPVSPQANQKADNRRHPLLEHSKPAKRLQSPGHHHSSSKRKISESKRPKMGPVSRSSSATNVVTEPGSRQERGPQSATSADAMATKHTYVATSGPEQRDCDKQQDKLAANTGHSVGEQALVSRTVSQNSASVDGEHQDENEAEQEPLACHEQSEEPEEEEEAEVNEEDEDDFDIPVSFALFLLITYMMAGAFVFSIWEGWNFFDALYFVFISMSTIGFGDLVPQHPKRMVGTFAYLLFGLALTSMCINVVQEKIHATFLRAKMQIGEKMGFDLEQIMADDYYGEIGSAYDDYGATGGSAANCDVDSIGVSSTSAAIDTSGLVTGGDRMTSPITSDGTIATTSQMIAKSKSKDSLKYQAGSSAGLKSKPSFSSSFRRRSIVSTGKANRRQASNSSAATQTFEAPAATSIVPASAQVPIRAQLETIKMGAIRPAAVAADSLEQPSINQPVDSRRAFCEPIHVGEANRVPNDATRSGNYVQPNKLNGDTLAAPSLANTRPQTASPLLTASKSLDSTALSAHNQLSSSATNFFNRNATFRRTTQANGRNDCPSQAGSDTGADYYRRHNTSGSNKKQQHSPGAPRRRASVSHELNQLDDLIVSLSRSRPERFGPLLGIPISGVGGAHSSRSVSSPNSKQIAAANNNLPASRKKSTLAIVKDTNARHSFYTKSPKQEIQTIGGGRRKSSNSVSGRRPQQTAACEASESQAALDELEAIKFSAV